MRRVHLIELEDQPWCPAVVRDGGTDYLRFVANASRAFDAVAPRLRAALRATGARRIVDLCSGGGGPWRTLYGSVADGLPGLELCLTDLYPNAEAFARARAESGGRFTSQPHPVDARAVPGELTGFRTLFNGLHHFRPLDARGVLADAVAQGQGIAVVDLGHHRALNVVVVCFAPLLALLVTPFIRPFRWSRLALTYLLPLIPLLILFDGIVSALRIYSPDELRELVSGLPGDYAWDIGTAPVARSPVGLTYLIGTPPA